MAETKAKADAQIDADRAARIANVKVERVGEKIIVPANMLYEDAIAVITRMKSEDERVVRINEVIDAYPFDGAHALMMALKERYGWAEQIPEPGFWGPQPPHLIAVEVASNGTTVQVPWGRFSIPGVPGYLATDIAMRDKRWVLSVIGETQQKHREKLHNVIDDARRYLKENSLYRGKAIRVSFEDADPDAGFNPSDAPRFMDLAAAATKELIFSDHVMDQIQTSIWTPIEYTAKCRAHGVPLKRGILLEGRYGTGKTLCSYVTAAKAVANGWTFIHLEKVSQLGKALRFARNYAPCVIFAEDVDAVMRGDDEARTEAVNGLLNAIDGIESKGVDILVVLTTNAIEAIQPAMLRPGRIDAVISVAAPDAEVAERLLRMYGRTLLDPKADLRSVSERLAGKNAASIREVIERAKLTAIGRPGDEVVLLPNDLEVATTALLNHARLTEPKEKDARTDVEQFGAAFGAAVAPSFRVGMAAALGTEAAQRLLASGGVLPDEAPAPAQRQSRSAGR